MKREGQSFCLKSAVDDSERRFAGWIFPVFLGFLFACGTNAASMASIPFNKLSFYEQWALFSALFCVTFRYGFVLLQKISVEATGEKEENKDESVGKSSKGFVKHFVGWFSFEHQKSWKSKMRDGMRIFMLWLPYILLLYPGIMYWDTGDQVAQFFGISVFGQKPGQIWDHHPFFDTYLYGAFLWLSHAVTGSYIIGIFLHALVQSALTGLVIACWLSYLKERGLQRVPLKVCTMFLCFFPVFPIMFASMSKDITHVVFFLAWSLMFMRLVDSRLEKFKDPRFLIGFFVLSLCAAMSKKIGLYIIALSLLLLIVGKFKARLKAIAIGVTIILYLIVNVALPNCYYKQAHLDTNDKSTAIITFQEGTAVKLQAKRPNYTTSATIDNIANATNTPLSGFQVADGDGSMHNAIATITGSTLRIHSDEVKRVAQIQYLWQSNPSCLSIVYNSSNLPMSPFTLNVNQKTYSH